MSTSTEPRLGATPFPALAYALAESIAALAALLFVPGAHRDIKDL